MIAEEEVAWRRSARSKCLTWSAAAFYVAAGFMHFLKTDAYVKIVPPHVPWPLAAVYLSGLAEIAGGAGLLVRPLRRIAAFSLIVLLLAVFPANIYMAAKNAKVTATPIPNWLLWIRLPAQGLLIWWLLAIVRCDRWSILSGKLISNPSPR